MYPWSGLKISHILRVAVIQIQKPWLQSLAARPHQVGHNIYEPIEEEDTDDEEASKIIEATKARSHLDEEKELNQPTKVNVNVKDEDTDDEFSKC